MNENYYVLKNGRAILDEDLSDKMRTIVKLHPERPDSDSTGFEWNEFGMASLFAVLYKKETRYCEEHKSWYTYEYGVWNRDVNATLVHEKIKDFVRLMTLYCGEIESYTDEDGKEDNPRKEAYTKFVNKMGDRRFRERILKDAIGELRINAVKFDSNPYLVNCLNGTYNLENFTFYEPKWDDFLTKQTRFNHTVDSSIRCKRWEQFIDEVCQSDKDKADFLQRALGYSLLGKANEECMFILYGKTTRNGKSTLLHTIQYMLGDYASVAPIGIICKNDGYSGHEAASPILANLKGKRFVTMAESNEDGKMDEEKIKGLTGGEEITARALYEKPITFIPQFSLWLSCNHLPRVTDKTVFSSNRLKVIEFNRHFGENETDKTLKDFLIEAENMRGIFNWLIEGYKKYKSKGLEMSKPMQEVVNLYKKDSDIVAQFLEAYCEKDPESRVKAKDLYMQFKSWARSNGENIISSKKFKDELSVQENWDLKQIIIIHGYPHYKGIKFKEII